MELGSTLTIIGARSVLPQKMLVQQVTGDWSYLRVELNGFQGHFSDDFKSQSILDRFLSTWSPHEWPVAVHEHSTNLRRIEILKSF